MAIGSPLHGDVLVIALLVNYKNRRNQPTCADPKGGGGRGPAEKSQQYRVS